MPESNTHKRLKRKAAGKTGTVEKKLKSGQRLDAITKNKATEIERSGTKIGLKKAVNRLKQSQKSQKVLKVPQTDMAKARKAMRDQEVSGTVSNLSGTKKSSIRTKKK